MDIIVGFIVVGIAIYLIVKNVRELIQRGKAHKEQAKTKQEHIDRARLAQGTLINEKIVHDEILSANQEAWERDKKERAERIRAEQESRASAEQERAERDRVEEEEIQRGLGKAQPAFDKLVECYNAYAFLPKTLERKDFIDSEGYLTYSLICNELIDCIDAINYDKAFMSLFAGTLVSERYSTYFKSTVFTQGIIFDKSKDNEIRSFFAKIKDDARKTKAGIDSCYAATYNFDKLMEDIPTFQPEADTSATHGEEKTLDDLPDIPMSKIAKNTIIEKICDFYVVDVETTGLQPYSNEIIQLTAMRFEKFDPVECFSTYVMPRRGLNAKAQEINGITGDDLEGAPYIEQIIAEFDRFIGNNLPLVGHNIFFDLKFLHAAGSEAILKKRRIFDTCSLARSVYESSKNYKLDYLISNEFRILRKDAHDSKSDCLAAGMLFKDICQAKIAV